ncbi:hypothetical protein ANTRET_LOCUS3202, partial [Anthophora retusa]
MMDVEETNTASTASSSPRPSSPAADSTFIRKDDGAAFCPVSVFLELNAIVQASFNNADFKSITSCPQYSALFFIQPVREEGAEYGRTQQPSRGNESRFHPAQQQRDGSREKPGDVRSIENRRKRPCLCYPKKVLP